MRSFFTTMVPAIGMAVAFAFSNANASVIYDYSVVVTGSTTASVYIKETLTNGSPSLVGSGLDGAAFKITLVSGSEAIISDVGFNPAFDAGAPFNSKTATFTAAALTESTNFGSPAVSFAGGNALIGSITFSAGTGSGPTQFTISPYSGEGGYVVLRDGTYLDVASTSFTPLAASNFSISVPEPASLITPIIGGLITLRQRHLRFKKLS